MRLPRPRVVANFAITWDGKTTTRTHAPTTFTSAADKQRLREIRAGADAVLAGAATVTADSMSMGLGSAELRAERVARGQPPEPLRVIVSRGGKLDPSAKVFQHRGSTVVIFSGRMPQCASQLPDFCDLFLLPVEASLAVALAILRKDYGVRRLVCEGGPRLFFALLKENLVDELYLTLVPRIFGGEQAPTLTGLPGPWLPSPRPFRLASSRVVGGELHARLIFHRERRRKN